MRHASRAAFGLVVLSLWSCERRELQEAGVADSAPDSVPVIEGFADAMEAEALTAPPCLTSRDTVRRNWTRQPVPELGGEIMVPPRFEAQRTAAAGSIEWVDPDSAYLGLLISRTEQGGHTVGMGVDGTPERRCSLRVGGRASRVVELAIPPRGRGDSAFAAVTIAFPSDDVTISATIQAPARAARADLLSALSTLTVGTRP
jgi:hypothetical protein